MRLKVEEAVRQALDKTRGHEVADKESACNCLDCHDAWAPVFAHPDFNLYEVVMGAYGVVSVGGLVESADTPHAKVLLERAKHRESRGKEWVSLVRHARLENERHHAEMDRLLRPVDEFDLEMQELAKRYGG